MSEQTAFPGHAKVGARSNDGQVSQLPCIASNQHDWQWHNNPQSTPRQYRMCPHCHAVDASEALTAAGQQQLARIAELEGALEAKRGQHAETLAMLEHAYREIETARLLGGQDINPTPDANDPENQESGCGYEYDHTIPVGGTECRECGAEVFDCEDGTDEQ